MNCLSIAFESVDKSIEAIKGFEIVEYRLDKIKFAGRMKDLFAVKAMTVATYQPVAGVEDEVRINALKQAIDAGANYIDIEIENSESYKAELINYARAKATKIIISYHDYVKTPLIRELEQLMTWASEYNPDIIKIACMVTDRKDSARLMSLYDSELNLIVIGMGELGRITRIASVLLGAPFTFVAFDKESKTADGQLSAEQLADILVRIKA
ncbi:MAG: type I 3-dehydroquinate dehydratase [Candidatus Margulisbacteria bacterium]|nr:type I 3-dehydroquinate dehydratase [Candidatus Margulisiibacteriota bacterium]